MSFIILDSMSSECVYCVQSSNVVDDDGLIDFPRMLGFFTMACHGAPWLSTLEANNLIMLFPIVLRQFILLLSPPQHRSTSGESINRGLNEALYHFSSGFLSCLTLLEIENIYPEAKSSRVQFISNFCSN